MNDLAARVTDRQIVVSHVEGRRGPLGEDDGLTVASAALRAQFDGCHLVDLLKFDLIGIHYHSIFFYQSDSNGLVYFPFFPSCAIILLR